MTNTYALGIWESGADDALWIKVDGPNNHAVLSAFAETLKANVEGSFSVADVISDLKHDVTVLGIFVGTIPSTDHTPHLFWERTAEITLYDREDHEHLVTRGVSKWASLYDVNITVASDGIPVN